MSDGSTTLRAGGGGAHPGRPGVGVRPTWEPWLVACLLLGAVWFGFHVKHRSVDSDRRRTDAGVFFRAGYAVRAGLDPYAVPDDNVFYFIYPPAIAAAFVPLADPPIVLAPENDSSAPTTVIAQPRPPGYLPYGVSIVLWYSFSVVCMIVAVECLARALLGGARDPAVRAVGPDRGGWWAVRVWPVLMVLPDSCSTLSKGQVNLVLVALIAAGVLLLSRGWRFWGGFALAMAAGIKVIPGLLSLDVLTRRGVRAILGYACCGVVVMAIAPVLVYGPERAWAYTREFTERVLLAGVSGSEDRLQSGAGFANTDNQSVQGSLHNLTNILTPRGERPASVAGWIKGVHLLVAAGLTVATLGLGWKRPGRMSRPAPDSALEITLRTGMLCCVMLMAAPMVHRHYFVLLLPAAAGLVFVHVGRSRLAAPSGWGMVLIPLLPIAMALPKVTDRGVLRDLPIALVCTVVVWVLCARELRRSLQSP